MSIQAVKKQPAENNINSLLVTMGLHVDEAVSRAIAALLHSDSHIVPDVLEKSASIHELEHKIDQAVFASLESGLLEAGDVKRLNSVAGISKDLSGLGELAANLGRKVAEVGQHNEHEDFSRLQPLAIAVSHLCRQTLRSLSRLNLVLARNAAEGGASVDAYRDYVLRGLSKPQTSVADDHDLHIIFASRCLEQIADHAVRLAQNLVTFLEYVELNRQPLAS
jgi:phosphate uptake regulator